jgi:thiamine biosynthesis lipoprotein ApbE
MGPAIHGQFVVPKSGGGYQTMDQQRGNVAEVSPTSITVTSEDNFTTSYAVTSTTVVRSTADKIADINKNDQVGVLAVGENGKVTAVRIVDFTQAGGERHKHGPRPQPSTSGSTQPGGMFD